MKKNIKPFCNYNDLINKLENEKNIEVKDKNIGVELLKDFPYYTIINGYQEYFFKVDEKLRKTSLNEILIIHLMDKDVMNVISKYSTYIEDMFKNKFAHCIGEENPTLNIYHKYYLESNTIFNKKKYKKRNEKDNKYSTLLSKITNEIEKIKRNKTNPSYYFDSVHGHIPPWILFKNLSFSDCTDLFSMTRNEFNKKVVAQYRFLNTIEIKNSKSEDKFRILVSILKIVRIYRNKITHNLKHFSINVDNRLKFDLNNLNSDIIKTLLLNANQKKIKSQNLYYCVICILLILDSYFLINNFIRDLEFCFNYYPNVIVSEFINMYKLPQTFIKDLNTFKIEYGKRYHYLKKEQ